MAKYCIDYDVYLGFSCMGGSVSKAVHATVDLSDEEVRRLFEHLDKFNLEEFEGIDFENLRTNDETIDTFSISEEEIDFETALPDIYDKLWDANWSGYRKAGIDPSVPCEPVIPNELLKQAVFSKRNTEVYYHGSGIEFDDFDLQHALEVDGKCKFGYGIYLTSSYNSAARYSAANPDWESHYIYTVEIPLRTPENTIHFTKEVPETVVQKVSEILGEPIPEKKSLNGKDFRKHIAAVMYRRMVKAAKKAGEPAPTKIEGEKAASAILLKAGIEYIEWPHNWRNPDAGSNLAVLDDSKIRILYTQEVMLNSKKRPSYYRPKVW